MGFPDPAGSTGLMHHELRLLRMVAGYRLINRGSVNEGQGPLGFAQCPLWAAGKSAPVTDMAQSRHVVIWPLADRQLSGRGMRKRALN
jgi:hypothetical protein